MSLRGALIIAGTLLVAAIQINCGHSGHAHAEAPPTEEEAADIRIERLSAPQHGTLSGLNSKNYTVWRVTDYETGVVCYRWFEGLSCLRPGDMPSVGGE